MKFRGEVISSINDAINRISANEYMYHGSHLFPAAKIRDWTIRKLSTVVKSGQLFVSVNQYDA